MKEDSDRTENGGFRAVGGRTILQMLEEYAAECIADGDFQYSAGVIAAITIMRMPYTWENWDADDGVAWTEAYNAIQGRLTERANTA